MQKLKVHTLSDGKLHKVRVAKLVATRTGTETMTATQVFKLARKVRIFLSLVDSPWGPCFTVTKKALLDGFDGDLGCLTDPDVCSFTYDESSRVLSVHFNC